MAGVGVLISSLIFLVTNLLSKIKNFSVTPSSSSSLEEDLDALKRMLKRIKVTLYDAEERDIRDLSDKYWHKELKEVGRSAEYIIDEYMYEVYRAQVKARNASNLSIRVPNGFVDRIREVKNRFDEIAKDRESLQLREEDGLMRDEGVRILVSSSHTISESIVFGREEDKEKVIELLFSNTNDGVIKVVPIVGKGGLGKTTLAQLVYNDKQVKQQFDLFGWICVSEDFNVERLMQELIESFTRPNCSIKNMGTLQGKIKDIVEGKKILVVLDDVWNEDKNLWEFFRAAFISASRAVFILTTRNDRVAKIMQTTPPFRLACLSEEESWSLFQHYAFRGINYNVHPNYLNIGRQITQKCDGLPLAVKSISSLLRYKDEEGWVEILENNLWEIYGKNVIFGALHISYARMPAYLRPCFLYCSLFPKDYVYNVDEVVELWISQGYIESEERKTLEEIASEYAVELIERSFFDRYDGSIYKRSIIRFKLHDMIHDLVQLNSDNEFYYSKNGQEPIPPDAALHVNIEGFKGHLTFDATMLRTLLLCNPPSLMFSKAKHLRVLKLDCRFKCPPSFIFSLYHLELLELQLEYTKFELQALGNLINLKFLSFSRCIVGRIPESFCLLSNLRTVQIKNCHLVQLPENIGNFVHLQKLEIHGCHSLICLPESLCKISSLKMLILTETWGFATLPNNFGNLTNLQNLTIENTHIKYLPRSFNNLNVIPKSHVQISLRLDGISVKTSWIKDFDCLRGTLAISGLGFMPSVKDAHNFNLVSKPYLEKMIFSWDLDLTSYWDAIHILGIKILTDEDYMEETRITRELLGEDMDLRVLENLQPHPNLKYLQVSHYKNPSFPEWMGDPLSFASLEELHLYKCTKVAYVSFGNLRSVKHLKIEECGKLKMISRESVPSQLERLTLVDCFALFSIKGLEDLESLVELEIYRSCVLRYFPFELISEDRCHKSSSSGLKNLSPLKKLKISINFALELALNEVIPSVHSNIQIYQCIGLKEWCLKHNISYTEYFFYY